MRDLDERDACRCHKAAQAALERNTRRRHEGPCTKGAGAKGQAGGAEAGEEMEYGHYRLQRAENSVFGHKQAQPRRCGDAAPEEDRMEDVCLRGVGRCQVNAHAANVLVVSGCQDSYTE